MQSEWRVFVAAAMAAGLGALTSIPGALAQSSPTIKRHGTGNIALDDRIAGCTALIESSAATLRSLNMARLRRAMFHVQKGEMELAIADYDAILAREPDNVPARLARASAYLRKHDNDAAIADYDWIIESDPRQPGSVACSLWLEDRNDDAADIDVGPISGATRHGLRRRSRESPARVCDSIYIV
ncbi:MULTISPECIES: tetratricopeptide repeat protein [unclassified Bradyrhizobium]|uniref:tetratricopeptide repeat protein n=1 Tax=unclassified Bradyrhizobium TaxID=2631580 RepID=UPI002916BB4C|nr:MULTISPECIES: hypothetical protein [unclassified Bradyrhizobium]